MKKIDWSGKKVGKLYVISEYRKKDSANQPLWKTLCFCGNEKIKSSRSLRIAYKNNSLASCGCISGKKKKDWSGEKVGKLQIIKHVGTVNFASGGKSPKWHAKCECGNTRNISSSVLRNAKLNNTELSCKNCPENMPTNLLGKKFGKLTVKSFKGKKKYKSGGSAILWECSCSCGNNVVFSSSTLSQSIKKNYLISCGCTKNKKYTKHLGKKIGLLKVLEKVEGKYICKCDCGNTVKVSTYNLTRAENTNSRISCGCKYRNVIVGEKYFRLTVISKAPSKNSSNKTRGFWNCLCICGNTVIVSSDHLLGGKTKSCGCWYKESRTLKRIPAFSYIIKKCPRCNKKLHRKFFGLDKNRPGGLKSLCKKCNYECKDFSKVLVKSALRKKAIKNATPGWVNIKKLEKIHAKRISLQESLNIELNVDHIIPLKHHKVCGLNVPNNLQITTKSFNASKSNRINLKNIEIILSESKKVDGIKIHKSVLDIVLE